VENERNEFLYNQLKFLHVKSCKRLAKERLGKECGSEEHECAKRG
jgi:hypothetical protein